MADAFGMFACVVGGGNDCERSIIGACVVGRSSFLLYSITVHLQQCLTDCCLAVVVVSAFFGSEIPGVE